MTVHISNVQRARILEEAAGSFGVDGSGTAGNYKDLPFISGTLTLALEEEMVTPGHVQQHMDARPIKVKLPKRAKATFEINLTGLGLASGGPRSQSALGRLLKIAFGGENLGTGSAITTGASTTSLPLTSASGIAKGMAIAAATGTGGRLEMREVKNNATNTLTLKHALSGIPANDSTIYAPATYYPSTVAGAGTACTSLQMICEGLEPDDRWLLLGGQVESVTFTLANGAIAKMAFNWKFADWDYADGSATSGDFAGPELAFATYANAVPIVIKDSELRIFDVGTTSLTSTLIDAPAYEFTVNLSYVEHMTPGGVNNIAHYVRTSDIGTPFVSGSFTVALEDQTWWTEKAEDDVKAFALQMGSSPTATTGGGVLLVAPAIQITDVQPVDVNGIRCQRVSWEGTIDGDITSPTANSDIHYAAVRIHLF
jgi:hypothetical protein